MVYLPPRHSAKARLRQSPGSWQSIENAGLASNQLMTLAVVPVSESVPGLLLASAQATARVAPHTLRAPRAIDVMAMAALLTVLGHYIALKEAYHICSGLAEANICRRSSGPPADCRF